MYCKNELLRVFILNMSSYCIYTYYIYVYIYIWVYSAKIMFKRIKRKNNNLCIFLLHVCSSILLTSLTLSSSQNLFSFFARWKFDSWIIWLSFSNGLCKLIIPQRTLVFQPSIFRCYVSFREVIACIYHYYQIANKNHQPHCRPRPMLPVGPVISNWCSMGPPVQCSRWEGTLAEMLFFSNCWASQKEVMLLAFWGEVVCENVTHLLMKF